MSATLPRLFTLLLVASEPPKLVTERRVIATNARRAVRSIRKQLVGVEVVHVILDGRRVTTLKVAA